MSGSRAAAAAAAAPGRAKVQLVVWSSGRGARTLLTVVWQVPVRVVAVRVAVCVAVVEQVHRAAERHLHPGVARILCDARVSAAAVCAPLCPPVPSRPSLRLEAGRNVEPASRSKNSRPRRPRRTRSPFFSRRTAKDDRARAAAGAAAQRGGPRVRAPGAPSRPAGRLVASLPRLTSFLAPSLRLRAPVLRRSEARRRRVHAGTVAGRTARQPHQRRQSALSLSHIRGGLELIRTLPPLCPPHLTAAERRYPGHAGRVPRSRRRRHAAAQARRRPKVIPPTGMPPSRARLSLRGAC